MVWLVIGVILTMVFMQVGNRQASQNVIDYSAFMEEARQGHIGKVKLDSGRTLKATTRDGKAYTVYTPGIQDPWMVSDLMKFGVNVEAKPEEEPSLLMNIFVSWFPMLLLIGVWIFFMRQMQGGGRGGAFSFGKSRARMMDESTNTVTFADVAGCEEAKEEVAELVDFLRDPSKFQKLGGRIPRGVLMVGNPGTGKTLLARAIAGEVKVPFFSISGSDIVARGTPGLSGADLANLVNEAALFAARGNKRLVEMDDFERAKDKIIMGAERRSMVMPEEERRNTAYHESGHAIVARLLPKTDPVHKVTIIPRGRALGVTMQLPTEDRYSQDRDRLLNMIAVLFGGRISEELFMKQMTTGAANDFERATEIARRMVTQWGMSDELGPMVYGENEGEIFLGRAVTTHKNVSEATMQKVDSEIRRIIDLQYRLARKLLEDNRDKVEAMTKALLEFETIDADQIGDIMAGKPPRPPKPSGSQQAKPPASDGGTEGATAPTPAA